MSNEIVPAEDTSKERFGDLPSRLQNAWRTYRSSDDVLSLRKDIELLDAIQQLYFDQQKALEAGADADRVWAAMSQKDWIDRVIKITLAREKLAKTEHSMAVKTKQFYTPTEVLFMCQLIIMAINEEDESVRARIKTRLQGSAVSTLFQDR